MWGVNAPSDYDRRPFDILVTTTNCDSSRDHAAHSGRPPRGGVQLLRGQRPSCRRPRSSIAPLAACLLLATLPGPSAVPLAGCIAHERSPCRELARLHRRRASNRSHRDVAGTIASRPPLGLQWSPGYYRLIDARHVRVVLFSPLTSLSERRVITVWTATDLA